MSDEIEIPIDKIQEDMTHAISHGGFAPMMNVAAILSALLAVAAAVSALFAGHYANEAMIEQIQSSDHWSYYQAKGIKLAIAEFRHSSADEESPALKAKIEGYKKDQEEIRVEAQAKEKESQHNLHKHEQLAASVTFFQVAIALTAIAVLTRKRRFLFFAGGLGVSGLLWTIFSFS